jgi:hypothetical protein
VTAFDNVIAYDSATQDFLFNMELEHEERLPRQIGRKVPRVKGVLTWSR